MNSLLSTLDLLSLSIESLPGALASSAKLDVEANDVGRAGEKASARVIFGDAHRYSLFAVHSRFGAVSWFVADAEKVDEATELPAIVVQEPSPAKALARLADVIRCEIFRVREDGDENGRRAQSRASDVRDELLATEND